MLVWLGTLYYRISVIGNRHGRSNAPGDPDRVLNYRISYRMHIANAVIKHPYLMRQLTPRAVRTASIPYSA